MYTLRRAFSAIARQLSFSGFLAEAASTWSEVFLAENQRLFPKRLERPMYCGTRFCPVSAFLRDLEEGSN